MTISVIVPIHDKPESTIKAVLEALPWDGVQVVLVLDRASEAILACVKPYTAATLVVLEGRPGWRSPCIAANKGLSVATGDVLVYNPSDVVQAAGNLETLRAHFAAHSASVLFGRVVESHPELCKGAGHAGPVLQGSDCTRPMTFLTAYPAEALRAIGGWDERFQEGVCYEDDDLAARLWKHGLDFVFDDRFAGIHQSHERAFDGNNASQGYWTDYRVGLNRTHMVNKHGRESAINVVMQTKPLILSETGRVVWKHA